MRSMKRVFLFSVLSLLLAAHHAVADETRRFLLIVDYIGSDYVVAVQGGKIVNAGEYREMESFSADALSLFASLPPPADRKAFGRIQAKLKELRRLVRSKADPSVVAGLTGEIKSAAVDLYQVTTFPLKAPSLKKAERFYRENCAACHGVDGGAKTALAKELNPPPTNFRDPSVMAGLSPFKAFNVLSFGIPGTGMPSFDAFNEQDRWSLAFYLFSLRFDPVRSPEEKPFGRTGAGRKSAD